jgi:hypothetical protein
MGLLGLMQLFVAPASGMLTVIKLVKGVPKHTRDLVTCRIKSAELRAYYIEFGVSAAG